jgi:hypothetical protein
MKKRRCQSFDRAQSKSLVSLEAIDMLSWHQSLFCCDCVLDLSSFSSFPIIDSNRLSPKHPEPTQTGRLGGGKAGMGESGLAAGVGRKSIFAFLLGDRLDAFAEQGDVEGLLEDFVETVFDQLFGFGFVFAGEADDQRGGVGVVPAEIADNLNRLAAAETQVDDDRVRMEALGERAGFETRVGQFVFEVFALGERFLDSVVEEFFGADEEHLVPFFLFEFTQRHAVFLQEPDELLAGNSAVLAARNPVAFQAPGVEPFRHGPGGHLTDLGDLAGGEHFFHVDTPLGSAAPVLGSRPPGWGVSAMSQSVAASTDSPGGGGVIWRVPGAVGGRLTSLPTRPGEAGKRGQGGRPRTPTRLSSARSTP